jgi:hypothetical protein
LATTSRYILATRGQNIHQPPFNYNSKPQRKPTKEKEKDKEAICCWLRLISLNTLPEIIATISSATTDCYIINCLPHFWEGNMVVQHRAITQDRTQYKYNSNSSLYSIKTIHQNAFTNIYKLLQQDNTYMHDHLLSSLPINIDIPNAFIPQLIRLILIPPHSTISCVFPIPPTPIPPIRSHLQHLIPHSLAGSEVRREKVHISLPCTTSTRSSFSMETASRLQSILHLTSSLGPDLQRETLRKRRLE